MSTVAVRELGARLSGDNPYRGTLLVCLRARNSIFAVGTLT